MENTYVPNRSNGSIERIAITPTFFTDCFDSRQPIEVTVSSFFLQQGMVTQVGIAPAKWLDFDYRHAYAAASIDREISRQVRVNREARGWTQKQLADRMGTGQSAISKLEDPDEGDLRLGTLKKAARAFDCALIVKLAPFEELASLEADRSPERLYVNSFEGVGGAVGNIFRGRPSAQLPEIANE